MRPSLPAPIMMCGYGLDEKVGIRVAIAEPRSRSSAVKVDSLKGVKKSKNESIPPAVDNFRYESPQSGPRAVWSEVPLPVAVYRYVPSEASGAPQIPPRFPFGVMLNTAVRAKLVAEKPIIQP